MAQILNPAYWLGPGYGLSGNNVTMSTADAPSNQLLTKLTNAEANPTTGDIREVFWSLSYMMYEKFRSKINVVPEQPTNMVLTKQVVANPDNVTQTETYTFVFVTTADPNHVAP